MAAQLILLFRPPAAGAEAAFERVYNAILAELERMPGIARRQVASVTGSPQPPAAFYRLLTLDFADERDLRAALLSAPGQAAGGILQQMPRESYELLFADRYEEAGGSTPSTAAAGAVAGDELPDA